MLIKKQIEYSLIALMGMALVGCSTPKTITINDTRPIVGGARHVQHAPIISHPQEIETRVDIPPADRVHRRDPRVNNRPTVIHQEPRNEPQVVVHHEEPKIVVPKNHPTLGIKQGAITTPTSTIRDVDRLNGETMARIPFPLDEYRNLKKIGRSTVSGKVAIINTMSEQEVLGKNLKLYLNPVTSYSTQWYNESYLSGYKMSKVDKRLYNYLKFSTSNGNGKFDFFGVAKGKYYLIGSMMCGEECGLSSTEKIRLVKEIYVGSGITRVDLTKRVP